jgi:P27 family predicted phage terminase small subunit
MAVPGRKPKPRLVAKDGKRLDGNPGKRKPRTRSTRLAPVAPREPAWSNVFEAGEGVTRLRKDASDWWRANVPPLEKAGYLSMQDRTILEDLAITVARIRQCERLLTKEGLTKTANRADRGTVKNHLTTVLSQYRTNLRGLVSELGCLSPTGRARLELPGVPTGGGGADDDEDEELLS